MSASSIEFIKTEDVKVEPGCDLQSELEDELGKAGVNAVDIRTNHTKCAEVFVMPKNNFLLICSFCEDLYESMLDFGKHFFEKHCSKVESGDQDAFAMCLAGEASSRRGECGAMEDYLETIPLSLLRSGIPGSAGYSADEAKEYVGDSEVCFPEKAVDLDNDSGEGSGSEFEAEDKSMTQSTDAAGDDLFCQQCERQYKNRTTFSRHMRNMHGKKRRKPADMVCRYCDKKFATEDELKQHKNSHDRFRPYQCPHCPKAFTSNNHRQKHINMHMGYRPFQCAECPSAFRTESNLRQHMLTHAVAGKLSCEICGKQFIHQSRKDVHMRSHTGEKPFQCELCGRKFIIRSRLTEHMKRHNNTRDYECEVCGKKFYTNVMLRHHQVAHSTDRPFMCNDCGKTFPRKLSLKMHRKIHSDVKQYSCNICGRDFKQYAGLYAHRRSHGEKQGLPQTNIAVSDKYTQPTHLLVVKKEDSFTGDS